MLERCVQALDSFAEFPVSTFGQSRDDIAGPMGPGRQFRNEADHIDGTKMPLDIFRTSDRLCSPVLL